MPLKAYPVASTELPWLSTWLVPQQYTKCFKQLRHKWSPLLPNSIWIWFVLPLWVPEHHNFLNSAIPCPVPQPMQHLTNFHNNYPASAIHPSWMKENAVTSSGCWLPSHTYSLSLETSRITLIFASPPSLTLYINAPPHIPMSGPMMLLSTPYHCYPFMTLLTFVLHWFIYQLKYKNCGYIWSQFDANTGWGGSQEAGTLAPADLFAALIIIVYHVIKKRSFYWSSEPFVFSNVQKNVSARATEILDSLMIWFS